VPVDYNVEYDLERAVVHFQNLFNGNKLLGEIPVHREGDISFWVRYQFTERAIQVDG